MAEEVDETGDEFDGTEVMRFTPARRGRFDDVALEYSIRAVPEADSGLIVYGRYARGWLCNPSLRPVVRELLTRLGINV